MVAAFCFFSSVLLLVFTGCEQRVSPGNIEVVNRQQDAARKKTSKVAEVTEGLSMKEVESILGQPKTVKQGKITKEVMRDFNLTTWFYEQDGQQVELSFIDGKLQRRVAQFGEQVGPEDVKAPLKMKKAATTIEKN